MKSYFYLLVPVILLTLPFCHSTTEPASAEAEKVETTAAPVTPLTVSLVLPDTNAEAFPVLKSLATQLSSQAVDCSYYDYREVPEDVRLRSFLDILARDFENKDFLQVKEAAFLEFRLQKSEEHACIRVEEWLLEGPKVAAGIFSSLPAYKDISLHWKPEINWIWIQKNDRIYRISSEVLKVKSESMNLVMKELQSVIGEPYERVVFEY